MTVKMAEPATSTTVHRCRFVDFTPSAITALAFPPPLLPPTSAKAAAKAKVIAGSSKLHFDMLAIGRANGNIEIAEWTPQEGDVQAPQAWTVRKVCLLALTP
jgi:U3 small nucleolar RNA-associated protein 4